MERIFFTSRETCSRLSGYVSNQTSRVLMRARIRQYMIRRLVWCVISRTRIIGPILSDNAISWERYYEVVLYPFMGHSNEDEIARGYSEQDGATALTARVSVTLLRVVLGDRTISSGHHGHPTSVICGEQ
jgi:hypothetical protein